MLNAFFRGMYSLRECILALVCLNAYGKDKNNMRNVLGKGKFYKITCKAEAKKS